MRHVAYFATQHPHARPARKAHLALHCSVVAAFVSFGCAREGFAASQVNFKMACKPQAIPVGQQQTGLPLKLHAVFEGFNPDTGTLKLTHLAGIESFWDDAMRVIQVDRSVDVDALAPGMAVTAILKRGPSGQYYVAGLERN